MDLGRLIIVGLFMILGAGLVSAGLSFGAVNDNIPSVSIGFEPTQVVNQTSNSTDFWDYLDTPADINGANDLDWSSLSENYLILKDGAGDLSNSNIRLVGDTFSSMVTDKFTFQGILSALTLNITGNITANGYCNATECYSIADFLLGDNLGDHIATTNLDMVDKNITDIDYLECTDNCTMLLGDGTKFHIDSNGTTVSLWAE